MKSRLPRFALAAFAAVVLTGGVFLWRRAHPAHVPLIPVVLKGLAPVAMTDVPVVFPHPRTATLPNGLRVFVLEDHRLPTVEYRLSLRAGTVFEPLPGVADLTASMMTEGTQSRSELALAEATEQWGARLTVNADEERCALHVSGPSEASPALLEVLSDALLHPAFAPDRLERVKFQKTALDSQLNNSGRATDRVSGRLFYGTSPYAVLPATAGDYATLTQQDVIAFYERCYRPNGAVLGIAGDVRADAVLAQARHLFASWQPSPHITPLPPAHFALKISRHVALVDWHDNTDTHLTFQCAAVSRRDPDYIPFLVTNHLLGGYSSGRLFQNLREANGYTYGASSWLTTPSWPGLWGAATTVPADNTQDAVRVVDEELRRLRDGLVPDEELTRAKRSLIGNLALTQERPGNLLYSLSELFEYNLPPDYWQTYPARIQAVTAQDVQRIARTYLTEARVQIIAIGPAAKIEGGLRREGPVDLYDAAGFPQKEKNHSRLRLPAWLRSL